MKRSYLGAICGVPGSYGIVFLDFPGCVSAGDTLDEVIVGGAEALSGHIQVMLDHGEAVPEPSAHDLADVIAWLQDDDEPVEETWVELVPVQVDIPERGDLVTVRLKADLVRQIADMAERTATRLDSRDFIELAVEHELEHLKRSAA